MQIPLIHVVSMDTNEANNIVIVLSQPIEPMADGKTEWPEQIIYVGADNTIVVDGDTVYIE